MDLEEIIQRIIDNGNVEDMHKLSEILEETLELIQEYDEDCYKKYEMLLYKTAYGNVLNRTMAEEIVSKMKPSGMRWSMQETEEIQNRYGLNNIRSTDFFVVMNSAYNDYKDIFGEDIDSYIKFALDFINDEDAKNGKVFIYFTQIVE